MKIFFTTPYAGKPKYQKYIDRIISTIEFTGAQVISPEKSREYRDAFREENLKKLGDKHKIHYEFIRQGIANADAVIIEASHEDFRVGHEATLAIIYKKPILCLSLHKDYGLLIPHKSFTGVKYAPRNLEKVILDFLTKIGKKIQSKRKGIIKYSQNKRAQKEVSKSKIAVLGSINIDLVTKVPTIPQVDDVVMSEGLQVLPGGKATNAAIGLARLGQQVLMTGKIGNDMFGEEVSGVFKRESVNTRYVDTDMFIPTGTVVVTVDRQGKNTIVVNEDANIKINKQTIKDLLKKIDLGQVRIDCFYTTLEPTKDIVEYALGEFSKRGIMIFCDAAHQARPFNPKHYKDIEFLTANEIEASSLTGIAVKDVESAKRAMLKLRAQGANNLIVTLGSQGAVLLEKSTMEAKHFPGFKVKVVDETAAGDAFRAGFVSHFLQYHLLYDAIKFANRVGAYAVTKLGAYEALPTPDELEFFKTF